MTRLRLRLCCISGTNGDLIDSAPLNSVEVKKIKITMGQNVMANLNGKKYSLSVGHGATQVKSVGGGPVQIHQSRVGTGEFIAAFEALKGKKV